jgi:hypothetical protein
MIEYKVIGSAISGIFAFACFGYNLSNIIRFGTTMDKKILMISAIYAIFGLIGILDNSFFWGKY